MTEIETEKKTCARLSGWGRYPVVEGRERVSEDLEAATEGASLTRGLGRSYGDASLPAPGGIAAASRLADRVLAFDEETGLLRAEAGLSLVRMNRLMLTRGWFTPVTPGTEIVTLGGMIAADVHGKNHHEGGTFGRHVASLRMRVPGGRLLEVSRESEPELFRATLGGMGLTGHVLEASVRLKRVPSPWIAAESEDAPDLESLVERLLESSRMWPYTVAWADCLAPGARFGRGILNRGRWAEPEEAPSRPPVLGATVEVPLVFPDWFLNRLNIAVFNAARLVAHGRGRRAEVLDPRTFFYPLDAIGNWTRFYGRRGFTQYQCVIPAGAVARFFDVMRREGGEPFLCVVKDFGAEGEGTISFPKPGITLALDFPVRGEATQRLVDALNEVVIEEGGRVYLAKDAFTRREHYRAMDPRVAEFNRVRRAWDPRGELRSALSARLLDDDE